MKCSFFDCVHFWWSAGLVDELEPHLPLLYCQKNEMLIFRLRSTSDDQHGWSMDSKSICHTSPANKMKCSYFDYVQLLMINQAGWWTQTPSATPLQPIIWNAFFWIMFTSDDQPGWLMDSNPICHPSPAKEMKCSFLYYVQLLMISWAGQWTWTPSTTPLQPEKWNAHFCITFNIWCWTDWSMDLNLIHHPSPAKKMKCSFLGYVQLLMISRAVQWTQTPSATPLQPIKWNAHFWITFNFWWSAGLVDGLEPHPQPASSQKMKCSYFDYVQLLMIGQAVWWTQTTSTTPLQPIKWNASFWIMFNFWWSARLVDGLKPHLPPLSSQ